jgi:hypothetical protein
MNPISLPGTQIRLLVLVALTLVLGGCGGKDAEEAAAPKRDKSAEATPAKVVPDDGRVAEEQLANAVVVGKSVAPVMLKYDIPRKPEVGTPFEITLTFLTRQTADALEADVTGKAGLNVTTEGPIRFEGVSAVGRYDAKVHATADAEGLYYVGVVARVITKVQTDSRTFSVPVVVGSAPAAAEQKPAAATDAQGEPIQSTPAKETVKEGSSD